MKGYRSYRRHGDAWIGGFKMNGTWYWQTAVGNVPITVHDWLSGPPNRADENCLRLNSYYSRFDDDQCTDRFGYICERRGITSCK